MRATITSLFCGSVTSDPGTRIPKIQCWAADAAMGASANRSGADETALLDTTSALDTFASAFPTERMLIRCCRSTYSFMRSVSRVDVQRLVELVQAILPRSNQSSNGALGEVETGKRVHN